MSIKVIKERKIFTYFSRHFNKEKFISYIYELLLDKSTNTLYNEIDCVIIIIFISFFKERIINDKAKNCRCGSWVCWRFSN